MRTEPSQSHLMPVMRLFFTATCCTVRGVIFQPLAIAESYSFGMRMLMRWKFTITTALALARCCEGLPGFLKSLPLSRNYLWMTTIDRE